MSKFEVFIPTSQANKSLTLQVDADNWLAGLKAGLAKIGERGSEPGNLFVDIMGNSTIHVTDPSSGRVFRIRELIELAPTSVSAAKPSIAQPKRSCLTEPVNLREIPTLQDVPLLEEPATGQVEAVSAIGRTTSGENIDEVLASLFERTQEVYGMERSKGMTFLLDLALESIPAESGSVFVIDHRTRALEIISARGPKAKELLDLRLRMPMGKGIVGFCAQEGVGLAISDTENDARFYKDVSKKIGYSTKSILCAPMIYEFSVFGCLEVINKKDNSHFTSSELAILSYIAHQGAKYVSSIN